jgi:hypothetical protein
MRLFSAFVCVMLVSGSGAVAACGGGTTSSNFGADDDGGADASTDAASASDANGGDDAPSFNRDGSADAIGSQEAVVYGHSAGTLYRVDPVTEAVSVVAQFQGCSGSVIDLALDKDSNMFVTTFNGFYRVDRTNAKCTQIQTGNYPNSLSFVPKGTVDPNAEALVAYRGSEYIRIDTTSGAISSIGNLGGGLSSSGDIVSVIGGGTYLTVKGTGCNDCIVEVNPATGALVKNWGSVGHADVFGLAFWAGVAFGFDNGGEIFTITFSGSSVTTANVPIPNAPPSLSFYGAGSTTSAPPGPR